MDDLTKAVNNFTIDKKPFPREIQKIHAQEDVYSEELVEAVSIIPNRPTRAAKSITQDYRDSTVTEDSGVIYSDDTHSDSHDRAESDSSYVYSHATDTTETFSYHSDNQSYISSDSRRSDDISANSYSYDK
jgi:hypothetical protein